MKKKKLKKPKKVSKEALAEKIVTSHGKFIGLTFKYKNRVESGVFKYNPIYSRLKGDKLAGRIRIKEVKTGKRMSVKTDNLLTVAVDRKVFSS